MHRVNNLVPPEKSQQGAALAVVLILMGLLVVLSYAAYQISANKQSLIAWATGGDKALYAAEQGYNRCLWRLNNDGYKFLPAEDPSPEKITLNSQDYNRYDLAPGPNYRLQVLVPLETVPGQIDLKEDTRRCIVRSTGWEKKKPDRLRTIEVEVKRSTFTEHVMANDSEEYNGTPVYWTDKEVIYGPLHTNDTLYVRVGAGGGPTFHGLVTYVNGIATDPASQHDAIVNNPDIFRQGNRQAPERLSFPPSSPELLAHARIDGHYYNGRTCITLLGDKYNVRTYDQSTDSWYYNGVRYRFNPLRDPIGLAEPQNWWFWELMNERADNKNGKMFSRLNEDGSVYKNYRSFADLAAEAPSLPLPNNGVIYVDGVTGDGDGGLYKQKYTARLGNVFVGGQLNGRLTIAAANDIFLVGHDATDWKMPPVIPDSKWYDPTPGVTYFDTTFEQKFGADGKWTHTEVKQDGDDMLGLVAGRRVQVLHYNWPSQYHGVSAGYSGLIVHDYYCWTLLNSGIAQDRAPYNISINGAIYAGGDCFGFEVYDQGLAKGTAYLIGSITQKQRGPVGTGGAIFKFDGYTKNYSHDPRMLYDAPPHFPTPTNMGYRTVHWNESKNHITAPVSPSP